MPVSVTMPRLGESVSEGTVTRWLKKAGERVEADEPLLEVSTDKVDTEIPSPASGVLTEIKVQEDETVDVGVELAIIDDGARRRRRGRRRGRRARGRRPRRPTARAAPAPEPEPAAPQPEARPRQPAQSAQELAAEPTPEPAAPAAAGAEPRLQLPSRRPPPAVPAARGEADGNADAYVTPLVRKLASEHGVDLAAVAGTGVGGRIRKQDVLDAAGCSAAAAAPAAGRRAAPAAAPRPRAAAAAGRTPPPGRAGRRGSRAARPHRAAVPAAQGHRRPRMVESLQVSAAAHHGRRGRRHPHRPAAGSRQGDVRGPRGRQAVVPAVLRAGDGRGAEGAPERQRQHRPRGRHGDLPRRRAPGHRRRHRPRAAGPGHQPRRGPQHRRAWPARSPTWPTAPAATRSARTSSAAARSR